jgi:hypothetical protein
VRIESACGQVTAWGVWNRASAAQRTQYDFSFGSVTDNLAGRRVARTVSAASPSAKSTGATGVLPAQPPAQGCQSAIRAVPILEPSANDYRIE